MWSRSIGFNLDKYSNNKCVHSASGLGLWRGICGKAEEQGRTTEIGLSSKGMKITRGILKNFLSKNYKDFVVHSSGYVIATNSDLSVL